MSPAVKPPVASNNKPIDKGPLTPPTSAAEKNIPPAAPARAGPMAGISTKVNKATVIMVPRQNPCSTRPAMAP